MNIQYGNNDLEYFIKNDIQDLQKYIANGNVNPQYVERMNKKISELTEINNGIYMFKFPDVWAFVESEMERLENINYALEGHLIEFNVDYSRWNWSKIRIPNELL